MRPCQEMCLSVSTVTTHTSFITHPLGDMTGLDLTFQHALCWQQYVRNDRLRYLHTSLSSLGCSGLSQQKNTSKSQIIRRGFMQRQVCNCSPGHRFVTDSSGLTQSACSCLLLVTSRDAHFTIAFAQLHSVAEMRPSSEQTDNSGDNDMFPSTAWLQCSIFIANIAVIFNNRVQ